MIMNYSGLRDGLRHLLDEAYERGFKVSGEGWNGEHPGDAEQGDYFKEIKRSAVDQMISELFPGKG